MGEIIRTLDTLADEINKAHRRCEQSVRMTLDYAVEVGRLLIEAKAQCDHGEWLPWVENHCECDVRSVQRYMKLAGFVPTLPSNATRVSCLPIRDLVRLERLDGDERQGIIDHLEGNPHLDGLDDAVTSYRREGIERRREESRRTHGTGGNIITGDLSVLDQHIEDETADLFFCDPPYTEDGVSSFGRLAEMAKRKLKPGGLCACYTSQMFLPEILDEMRTHLEYWWQMAIHYTGSPARVFKRKVLVQWRSVLVMYKPPASEPCGWLKDAQDGSGRDKDHHEWGQSVGEAQYWIERMTLPGGLVVDPFCGGGTVPVACKLSGRRWIASEIDAGVAAEARRRVEDVPVEAVA